MCVCLTDTHIRINESGAILWLQTRFPNKRRMLSMASRVFHWNHTFIQPVSCPGVFLSAWTQEEREPSVSLSPLSLFPPHRHILFLIIFNTLLFPSITQDQLMWAIGAFSLLDCASLVLEWHKHMTHKVSQTNSGLLLRKWCWIRRRDVFLGLVQENTHTFSHTHTHTHTYEHIQLSKKKKHLRFAESPN